MKTLKATLLFLAFSFTAFSQMYIDGDTLFGNEWINYNQDYYKITLAKDGLYKITFQELSDAGVFSGATPPQGNHFQMYYMGKEVPIYSNQNGPMTSNDYIVFYGKQNKGSLDAHLYLEAAHTNPEYSLFTDTSAYFLTWDINNTNNLRYANTPNDLSNLPSAESYYVHEVVQKYNNTYWPGRLGTGSGISWSCVFDIAEGWTGSWNANHNITISADNIYSNGPPSNLSTRYSTKANNHNIDIGINGESLVDTTFSGDAVKEHGRSFNSSNLQSSNTVSLSTGSTTDQLAISYIKLNYPRTFNFSNSPMFSFKVAASATKKYLEITNFNSNGSAPVLFDRTNSLRIQTVLESNVVKVVLPPSVQQRDLVLVSDTGYKSIIEIEKRNFINYDNIQGDYIIVSHSKLFNDGLGNNYVQGYADYRSSAIGGSFNTVVVDIQQVFDQFSYGIDRHEVSLRNFTHYSIKEWNSKYLFLIGKGVNYYLLRTALANWNQYYRLPAFGTPQSDNLIAASNSSNIPDIPVGRLAAITPHHVELYLRKVKAFEQNSTLPQTIEDKAWMKRIVHLGGGDPNIQSFIRGELQEVEDIIEDGTYGAKVFPFYKNSSDVIQEAPSEQITELINSGLSMITFFGHSAPSTLDFDLEDPNSYSNFGKYPLVYTIGCHTSRMFEFNGTLSEQWVLAEDKGAIAFIGATWETTLSNLSAFAKYFYTNLATENYGDRLGDVFRKTIIDFDLSSSFYAEQLKQVTHFHGDPALKLNNHEGPDYLVDGSKVSTSPSLVNTQMDSFSLQVSLVNIGSATPDSFLLRIEHELPNGTIIPSTSKRVRSPGYEVEHLISIPVPKEDILGFNKLHITVDALDSIPELPGPIAEMNNTYKHTFYVVANDAFPVYPYDYSIVSEANPTLKASSANAFAEFQKYYLQIDTTAYFNSPLHRETIVSQSGGVISWNPTIPYTDNTVYYWRISIDSTLTTGYGFNWHESSFIYKGNSSPGWNQSHFHQLKKENQLNDLDLEEPNRKLDFGITFDELKIKNGPYPLAGLGEMSPILNGGVASQYLICNGTGFHVVVINPETFDHWEANPYLGNYGSHNCLGGDIFSFPFYTNNVVEREKLINFLDNVVPENYYVVVYSIQSLTNSNYYPEDWALDSINNTYQRSIFQVLEEQGATKVRQLETTGSVPYFFIYQKNNPTLLEAQNYNTEVISDSLETLQDFTFFIERKTDRGNIVSTIIGPATKWESLKWEMQEYEPASDQIELKVYGIDQQNNALLLHSNISVFDTLLTHIDAQQYPYLRLEFASKDSIFKTTPNLNYWRVLYDPAPDAALRPDVELTFQSDTIQQGETLQLDIAVENISISDMDSLLVHYTVIDQNNTSYLTGTRMAPLLKGDTTIAKFAFDSRDLTTPYNQLLIEVNPNNDQLEQYHFNNVGLLPFFLTRDISNPLLDVTFDGVHILDGDLVSAKPVISIAILDENKNLALSDTSIISMRIMYPNETQTRKINMSDETVTFYPAEEGKLNKENKARIEIRNYFEEDGIYELFIDAEDQTGNDAGEYDYKIRFEVINKAMVSNVFNYPNPFSTSTQFVFTLTGADIPDFMKIQIMTTSGKVIREITNDELGPIHVGKNITEFRWNGTDEYGDRLANGVYLYRVVTRKADGQLYDDYNTNTDQYFKKGIGKLVIIR